MDADRVELPERGRKRLSFKDWIPVLVVLATVIPSVIGWCLNESSKRKEEDFKRKEARYIALCDSFSGFMSGTQDRAQQGEFIKEFRVKP